MKKKLFALILPICLVLGGCGAASGGAADGSAASESEAAAGSFAMVSQEEAQELMETEEGYIILDVRTQEEFAEGHIPGAVCVPNEEIGTDPVEELPDKDQLILVYCRSGNRSKQAAQKLAAQGYTNIVEFGGINTWPGEVVTE